MCFNRRFFLCILVFLFTLGGRVYSQKGQARIAALSLRYNTTKDLRLKYKLLDSLCNGLDLVGEYHRKLDSALTLRKIGILLKDNNLVAQAYCHKAGALRRLTKMPEAKRAADTAFSILPSKKKITSALRDVYEMYTLIFMNLGKADSSLVYGYKALAIDSMIADNHLANSYNNLAIAHMAQNNFVQANAYFFKSLKLARLKNEEIAIGRCLINIGSVYSELSNLDMAEKYWTECYTLRKNTDNRQGLAAVLGNLSGLYVRVKKYDLAIEKSREAIYYAESIKYFPNIATAYNNLSVAYDDLGKPDSALFYAEKMVALSEEKQLKNHLVAAYMNLGAMHSKVKRFADAKTNLLKSLDHSKIYAYTGGKGRILNRLSEVCEKLDQFDEALRYHKQAKVVNDSIYNEKNTKSISKLEIDFQTEKKDKEIALQNVSLKEKAAALLASRAALLQSQLASEKSESEILQLENGKKIQEINLSKTQTELESKTVEAKAKAALLEIAEKDKLLKDNLLAEAEFTRNTIVGGILLALVIGFLVFNRFKLSQQLAHQQAILDQRKRLSADLHDDVGATLSSISIYTEAIKNKLKNNEPERVMELVNKIGENSRETISTLGDIVWNLNPINDSAEKLFNRMESTATLLLSAQNAALDFSADPELFGFDFSLEAKQNLYLIFKETINNSAKYANASEVIVSIKKADNTLEMKMEDNGKGFDLNQNSEGNGLRNIRLRTEALNGSVAMSSSSSGTKSQILLPLSELGKG